MRNTFFVNLLLFSTCLAGVVLGQTQEIQCSLPGPCPPKEPIACLAVVRNVFCYPDPDDPANSTWYSNCCVACSDGQQQINCKEYPLSP